MRFGLNTTGIDRLQRDLSRWSARFPDYVARGIQRGATVIERHMREVSLAGNGPGDRTLRVGGGALRRGIGQTSEDSGLTRYVGTDRFYILTHEGLVPGVEGDHVVIRPRTKRMLAFPPERKSRTRVFANQVRIPIRRPIAYTYEQTQDEALQEAWRTVRMMLE